MAIDWVLPLIGFASGIGVSAVAAVIAGAVQRNGEQVRRREQAAFHVYMQLLELNSHYFWVASNELHGEPPPPEIEKKVHDLAWRIADALRECDDVPHLEEIVTILMEEDAYPSANERAKALDQLLDKLGDAANPKYMHAIRAASSSNLMGFLKRPPGQSKNSPANMGVL